MAKVYINGVMVENMKANGKITKCMEKEHLHGQMGANISENMIMIKNKAMANFYGLTEDVIGVNG